MKILNSLKILICDDQELMRKFYKKSIEKIFNVSIETCERPEFALKMLREEKDYSLLIMDIEFPEKPGSQKTAYIGHLVLPIIRKEFPNLKIVVVTQIGKYVYKIITESFRNKLLDDWINVGKPLDQDEIYARITNLLYPKGIFSERGVWLLQLSDLHFGKTEKTTWSGALEDGKLFDELKKDLLNKIPKDNPEFSGIPDIVIFNGDLTNNASDKQYEKVNSFIERFKSEILDKNNNLTSSKNRIIIIPGNHDINFDISRARCISVKINKVKKTKTLSIKKISDDSKVSDELKYLDKYMWSPFSNFINGLRLEEPTFSKNWNLNKKYKSAYWNYDDIGLTIFGLNTSYQLKGHFDSDPKIEPEVINELSKDIEEKNYDQYFPNILVLHHTLASSASGKDRVDNDEIAGLKNELLGKLNCTINLTGHIHEEAIEPLKVENKQLLFIGAGSPSVSKDDKNPLKSLSYNLIHLFNNQEDGQLIPAVRIITRVFYENKFIPKPETPVPTYRWNESNGWIIESKLKI